jgi:Zn-dependent metalloprotease
MSQPPLIDGTGEDCIPFNTQTTTVQQINQSWKVVDGSQWILDFGVSEQDARKALAIINNYDFNETCYVGRPNAEMTYFLAIPKKPTSQFSLNPSTGVPNFISFGIDGLRIPESSTGNPERIALGFFERYPLVFGTADIPNQLRIESVKGDAFNMTHVVLQQIYGGLPVFGAELRVHIRPNMVISSINGDYVRDPQVPVIPDIAIESAEETAVFKIARMRLGIADPTPMDLIREENITLPSDSPSDRANARNIEEDIRRPAENRTLEMTANASQPSADDLARTIQEVKSQVKRVNEGPIIFPGNLSQFPENNFLDQNHISYQFRFPEADVFVSATNNDIAFIIPNRHSADRLVYDALGNNPDSIFDSLRSELIMSNGRIVSTRTPNPEISISDTLIRETLGLYADFGATSYDNDNSAVELFTNAGIRCPNAQWSTFWDEMYFCTGWVKGDIVAHEFTHGVTDNSAGLIYLDEPGALNEHYSDVMGAVAFPESEPGSWLIGDNLPPEMRGTCTNDTPPVCPIAIRDMENPGNPDLLNNPPHPGIYSDYVPRGPECTGLDDVMNRNCDYGNVHENSGIGNRAAVLLSDGLQGTNHQGIGKDRLGILFHNTLTTKLHPWSTYLDERLNTWQTAMDLAALGVKVTDSSTGRLVDFNGVMDEVSWAFTQVGVDRRLNSGWYEIEEGLLGDRGTLTFYDGEVLPSGSLVADVELALRAFKPGFFGTYHYWEGRARVSNDNSVTFPTGIFGATITSHGMGTPNMRTTVNWWHDGYLHPNRGLGDVTWMVEVNIIPTQPLPPTVERVTDAKVHWSFILGGRGDDVINQGRFLSGTGCIIDDIVLELLNSNYETVATTSRGSPDAQFGSTGARIISDYEETNNEEVKVHWWFDAGSAVRYKLRYYLTGKDCNL